MKLFDLIFGRMIDRRIAAFQNDLIARHCEEVQNINRQMRGWRHDYHNHIQAMKAHLALGNLEELDRYLSGLDADLTRVDTIVKTGNVMADAILNSKLSLAGRREIRVNAKAQVPGELSVAETDLCVLLGNLLDNAMEGCLRLENPAERFIRLYIRPMKGQLYISVTNSAGRGIKKRDGKYFSTKESPTHGFGLARIDRIAARYGGYVNRQDEPGVFATEVMLPL